MNLLLTGAYNWTQDKKETLENLGFSLHFQQYENEKTQSPEIYDVVICNGLFKYNSPTDFKKLRMIQLLSAGIDESLADYAEKSGIILHNAKDVYSIPIAETAVMQILNICKSNREFIRNQNLHIWKKQRNLIELSEKKALIVGYGGIGKETAKRLKAFGVEITVANRSAKNDDGTPAIPIQEIEKYASLFDFVVICVALTEQTTGLVSRKFLENTKHGAVLVNVSRGAVTDENALVEVLSQGKISAALDVFAEEPLSPDSPLWDMNNVYITPHNSFVSDKIAERMYETVLASIVEFKEKQI